MKPLVRYLDLGHMPYQEAWDYQTALHRTLVDNKLKHRDLKPGAYPQAHHFLVVEHPPVYTLGKSGSMAHLLLSEDELQARGIQFYPINRGGDITFHGPGQIVGYPILDLECFFTDVHRYVRSIEEMVIATLAEYGIEGYRIAGYTGVWVSGPPRSGTALPPGTPPQRKICAIGVHLSRWVTLHGFAFNINTTLDYFRYIVPCGINDADKTVSSLAQELGQPVDVQEVQEKLRRHFARLFGCEWATDAAAL